MARRKWREKGVIKASFFVSGKWHPKATFILYEKLFKMAKIQKKF